VGIKRRLRNNLKCIGKFVYVPLFFNWLLIPLLAAMAYSKFGLDSRTYETVTRFSQYFTPILSVWWLLFFFAEYVEADGNEILFVEEKIKIKDYFTMLSAYIVSLIPPFAVYAIMFPNMIWEEIILLIDCVLFSAFAYLIVFCVRSVAATFLSLIVYELIVVFFVSGESAFNYISMNIASPMMIVEKYLLFLLVAAMALLGAVCVNARFRHYH
jgi:hypothetical protein